MSATHKFAVRDPVEVTSGFYKGVRGVVSGASYSKDWFNKEDYEFMTDNNLTFEQRKGFSVVPMTGPMTHILVPVCMLKLLVGDDAVDVKVQEYVCPMCLTKGDIFEPPNGACVHTCHTVYNHIVCDKCYNDYYKVFGTGECMLCTINKASAKEKE